MYVATKRNIEFRFENGSLVGNVDTFRKRQFNIIKKIAEKEYFTPTDHDIAQVLMRFNYTVKFVGSYDYDANVDY